MMTVRPAKAAMSMEGHDHAAMSQMSMDMAGGHAPRPSIAVMTVLSFIALAAGIALAMLLAAR